MVHSDTLRMIASLLAIVALIFALAWLARRTGWLRGHNTASMQLLGLQALGNTRATLALVQVADAQLVLGVTATQVTLLHTLDAQTTGRVPPGNTQSDVAFHTMLHTQQEP